MPKIVDHEATRRRILDAARDVFAVRGLPATGLDHVARRAGMARPTLYHYFPNKEALLAELAEDLLRGETEMFAAAGQRAGAGTVERIVAVSSAVAAVYETWSEQGRVLIEFWVSHPERFRTALASIRTELTELIEAGQRCGEIDPTLHPEAAASAIAGLIDGLLIQRFLDPDAFQNLPASAETVASAVRKLLAP